MAEELFINRYRVEGELGRGAMGTIYKAEDTFLGRSVALKMITAAQLTSENRDRLLSEARAAARLNHPNIVAVYDAGEENQIPFIVMELLEGGSLFEKKPQSLEEILSISMQICSALGHAHQNGIVHRDLKPENVLRSGNGTVKLNDFGMAHSFSNRISNEGDLLGTVYYIAPETIQGKVIDGRADLYALGVMLYEWLTGKLPFTAEDPVAVISQHLYAPLVPPRIYSSQISPELEDLVLKLLSKDPDDRPQSAAAVEKILTGIGIGQASDLPVNPTYRLDRFVRGKLVGREKELEQGRAIWHQVLTGSSQVLLVSGEPGIGKTRFTRELIANATISGGRCLVGECFSEGGAPYEPLVPMIRETMGEGAKIKLDLPSYVVSDLVKITPGLEWLQTETAPRQVLDALAEQQHIFESVFTWVDVLSKKNPLLLFFDDIHWGDSATLLMIRHLAHRLENQRVMIVLSYREIELRDDDLANHILHELLRDHLAARVKLTRFNPQQTGQMIATMLTPAGSIDPELVDAIHRETEGNPFFIEEVCKTLLEEGLLCYERGEWVSPGIEDITIPQSIRLTVQSRLSRLPEDAQDVLRLASVIGREFEFKILVKACEKGEDRIIECLEVSEKAQIIRELKKGGPENITFAFEHALVPATLREEISGLRRQRYHRRVAEAVEAIHPEDFETLSYHYEESGDADKAFENYRKAGSRALSVFANQEAMEYFEKALDLCAEYSCQADLYSGIAEAAFRLGKREAAEKAFLKAIELYRKDGDLEKMAILYAGAARAIWYMGEVKQGLEICKMGLQEMPEGLESKGMATLVHETARAYRFNYMYEEALDLLKKAIALARKLDLQEVLADCYATLGILRFIPYDERTDALLKAVEISEKNGYTTILARARLNLGTHYVYDGKPLAALEQYTRVVEISQSTGQNYVEFLAHLSLTDLEVSLSRYAEAETRLEKMLELQPVNPNPESAMFSIQSYRIIFFWCKGQLREALDLADKILMENKPEVLKDFYLGLLITKGRLLGELKDLNGVRSNLAEIELLHPEDREENPGSVNASIQHFYFLLREKTGFLEQFEILKKIIGDTPTVTQKILLLIAEARSAWLDRNYDLALAWYKDLVETLQPLGDLYRNGAFQEETADMLMQRSAPGDPALSRDFLEKAIIEYRSAGLQLYEDIATKKMENLPG